MKRSQALILAFVAVLLVAQGGGETIIVALDDRDIYAYGHLLSPPYEFSVQGDTFLVNGWQFSPTHRKPPPPKVGPNKEIKVSPSAYAKHALSVRAGEAARQFSGPDQCRERAEAAGSVYRADTSLVAFVTVTPCELYLEWKDGTTEYISLHMHKGVELPPEPAPTLQDWVYRFREDGVVIVAFGADYFVSKSGQVGRGYQRLIADMVTGDIDREYLNRFGYRQVPFVADIWQVAHGETLWAR